MANSLWACLFSLRLSQISRTGKYSNNLKNDFESTRQRYYKIHKTVRSIKLIHTNLEKYDFLTLSLRHSVPDHQLHLGQV